MKAIIKNTVDKKFFSMSVFLGSITAWLMKDAITPLFLGGKSFNNRSLLIQAVIIAGLAILISVSQFLLLKYLYNKSKKIKCWIDALKIHNLALITIAVAAFAIWTALKYANQPLLEAHAFRQTQTALTSYWFIREGWQLAYQTPVAGYPWSIPFEFPIYQSIVALIAWLSDAALVPIGRLVSFGFLIACAWPVNKITRRLNLPIDVAWVFCALLWSSPIYLFWGRTFMIETAAIFFILMAIPYAIDLRDPSPSWKSGLNFAFWASLGMLQKATTAAPVILVMAFVWLAAHIKSYGIKLPPWRKIATIAIAFSIPILIGMLWTQYTDFIKGQNLFGASLTSKALTEWNFGTVQQRLDLSEIKRVFWDRVLLRNAGGIFGISLIAFTILGGERRTKILVSICLSLFVLPIFIFTNLHYVHDYYQVSNVLFLLGALAISTVLLPPQSLGKYANTTIITAMLVISNLFFFSQEYALKTQKTFDISSEDTLALGDVIRRYLPINSGIVVFGRGWSSEIAYYSERKSFTVQDGINNYEDVWNNPSAYLGGKELGAIVFCRSGNDPLSFEEIIQNPVVKLQPKLFKVGSCFLWMPEVEAIVMPGSDLVTLPQDIVDLQLNSR